MKWGIFIISIFFSKHIHAQISITTSSHKLYLGEQITLTFSYSKKQGDPSGFFLLKDSLPHFEIVKKTALDSSRTGEWITYKQEMVITSFDSGRWAIPSQIFQMGKKQLKTDTLMISVLPVKLKTSDYYDVHDIIEVEDPKTEWSKWILVSGVVLALGILIYYLLGKRKLRPTSITQAKDPYKTAIALLDKLENETKDLKIFYSKLYIIFRSYLSDFGGADLGGRTTDEWIIFMKGKLESDEFYDVVQVVRLADAVKFAKYQSSAEEATASLKKIRDAIEYLHKKHTT